MIPKSMFSTRSGMRTGAGNGEHRTGPGIPPGARLYAMLDTVAAEVAADLTDWGTARR